MSKPSSISPPSGPLVGVRLLDFSSFIAGPYGAMFLGDLGAEVIKIEPLSGDLCRHWGPFITGESRFFQGWNRNKRSLAVDLRAADGREVVHELVRQSDVVMENFRPGVTERLRIDYPTLRELQPRLIYCSSTAFGDRGPYRDRPGYDPVLQAMGGAAKGNLRYSGQVAICSVAVSDYQAAMLAANGVMAALYHRERTGEGQLVQTSLLQAVISVQSHFFAQALDQEEDGPLGIYPYRFFESRDDFLFIAAGTDKFWRLLCEALEIPELGTDPRYDTNPKRVERADELTSLLQPLFARRSSRDWESLLVEKGVPCAAARTWQEFFEDPQVTAMEMNPVLHHPSFGRIRLGGVPLHFEKTPGRIQRAAPVLGEHSEEILREIGYDGARIAELRARGVIAATQASPPADPGSTRGSA